MSKQRYNLLFDSDDANIAWHTYKIISNISRLRYGLYSIEVNLVLSLHHILKVTNLECFEEMLDWIHVHTTLRSIDRQIQENIPLTVIYAISHFM
jgi:hypothetical protein